MCRGLQFAIQSRWHRVFPRLSGSTTYTFSRIGLEAAFIILPLRSRGNGEKMNHNVSTAVGRKPKRLILPLLVFLFVTSYGLLTMLVVLQDRTIDAQSDLIHLLFKEGRRLNVIAAAQKNQISIAKQRGSQSSRAQLPSSQVPKIQAPSSQVPMTQSATQIPSSQEKRQATAKAGKNQHRTARRNPFRPPAEMTDPSDMRRTLFSI